MIFQLPTPVAIRISAPISAISAEVSPIDPGMNPKNRLLKLKKSALITVFELARASTTLFPATEASLAIASDVPPVYPSIGVLSPRYVQTSPDI